MTDMSFGPLVSTEWLASHLNEETLRIYDCTVFLTPGARGAVTIESGLAHYEKNHVPGAGFLDLIEEISDPKSSLRFTMPETKVLSDAFSSAGIGDGTRIVLYCAGPPMWATRVWWMLRAIGFDNAAVLDGGFGKWKREGHSVETGIHRYKPGRLTLQPRPGLFAEKAEVLTALGDGAVCTMNALSDQMHRGEISIASRPGRIAGSTNLYALDLLDPEDGTFLPDNLLRDLLHQSGAAPEKRIITYCGGGIAATQNAFVLTLLGYDNVAVYDGSLSEWALDPDAPMEAG